MHVADSHRLASSLWNDSVGLLTPKKRASQSHQCHMVSALFPSVLRVSETDRRPLLRRPLLQTEMYNDKENACTHKNRAIKWIILNSI